VVAEEDVDGVYVLANGHWHDLGPLKAGERRDPLAAPVRAQNHLPGLPVALRESFSDWQAREPCQDPEHNHPPEKWAVRRHDWVVVAWRRGEPPRVAPVWTEARVDSRVVWVVQWP
jgi:hypothetical protein